MTHTPNPIYENKSGRTTLSLVFTILITGGLFLIIPLTQLSSKNREPEDPDKDKSTFISPPPMQPIVPDPPDKKDDEIEETPEMDDTFTPIPLSMITGLFMPTGEGPNQFVSGFNPKDFPTESLIFDPGDLDEAPKSILTAAPIYPPELKRARIEGTVEVIYVVTPRGKVTNIRITNADHRQFAEAVRVCLRRWSFEPGRKDNQDVATRVRQSFDFNLK